MQDVGPARGRAAAAALGADASADFDASTPSREGLDPAKLAALADYVQQSDAPIFSVLVSRHGKLVFELYTSNLTREPAHYVMSVTKSVTATLAGMAIDEGLLRSADAPMSELLPRALFANEADRARFAAVSLKDVLAMSALDAPVFPHQKTDDARARLNHFVHAENRAAFATQQALIGKPGESFLYTDVTPLLTSGAISYASKQTLFDYAQSKLFAPLGFRNAEWMHEDAAGIDNGAYGLRLRPVDMQKLGVLYLRGGRWAGKQLVPKAWVDASFTPWISSRSGIAPNYGWGWWAQRFNGKLAHLANGWKGQRIAIFPSEDLVVTMTGAMETNEDAVFEAVVARFVLPALRATASDPDPDGDAALQRKLDEVRANANRITGVLEPRMVPSIEAKEKRRPLLPLP